MSDGDNAGRNTWILLAAATTDRWHCPSVRLSVCCLSKNTPVNDVKILVPGRVEWHHIDLCAWHGHSSLVVWSNFFPATQSRETLKQQRTEACSRVDVTVYLSQSVFQQQNLNATQLKITRFPPSCIALSFQHNVGQGPPVRLQHLGRSQFHHYLYNTK